MTGGGSPLDVARIRDPFILNLSKDPSRQRRRSLSKSQRGRRRTVA